MSDKLSPMQEQLLGQASNILQSVTDTVSKAADFASAQVPDIALQYVTYGRASATALEFFLLLCVLLFAYLCIFVGMLNVRKMKDTYSSWSTERFMATMAGGAGLLFSTTFFMINLPNFFMVWFAPKVWLIKEIVNLVK